MDRAAEELTMSGGDNARILRDLNDAVADGRPVTPAFLFAALFWEPVRERGQQERANRKASGCGGTMRGHG